MSLAPLLYAKEVEGFTNLIKHKKVKGNLKGIILHDEFYSSERSYHSH